MGRKHRIIRIITPVLKPKLAEPLVEDTPRKRVEKYAEYTILLDRGDFKKIAKNLRKCPDDVKYIIKGINDVRSVIAPNARRVLVARLKNEEIKDFTILQLLKQMKALSSSAFSEHDTIGDIFADAARQGVDISGAIPELVVFFQRGRMPKVKAAIVESLKNFKSARFTAEILFHIEELNLRWQSLLLMYTLKEFTEVVSELILAGNTELADIVVTSIVGFMSTTWFTIERERNSEDYVKTVGTIADIMRRIRDAQKSQEEKVA
ncbi:MAG: hypothetical protein Q7S22_00365 [Candidatus Micrarchaeota archaeon]|nr:hypothetical protein [Candidatus Micrarchaeota archaeon]